ncbi:MAG: DUF885 family protein [Planctomycetota bacterium]
MARLPITCLLASFAAFVQPSANAQILRDGIQRYGADVAALSRRYAVPMSDRRIDRLRSFHERTLTRLSLRFEKDSGSWSVDDLIDWHLWRNEVRANLAALDLEEREDERIAEFLPFKAPILDLCEAREDVEPLDPNSTALEVAALRSVVEKALDELDSRARQRSPVEVARAARRVRDLRRAFDEWYAFRAGFDPLFTWWLEQPHENLSTELDSYAKALDSKLSATPEGIDPTLVAQPIGADALRAALRQEFIPYDPAELVAIAEREFEWCDREMDKAAKELGFDDWRDAQRHVKSLHVAPGEQPALVKRLVEEAIDWVTERDLVTVPDLCRETWRMSMLGPERQRISPYFLGGERIQVSYPTDSMSDADKRATMFGNNIHFSRAVAHHEVIPGHGLQQFMQSRHRPYRRAFSTPFWIEGWALYWEMRLWDLGFPRGPEDRIGMLFWRKHRCARIVFSLSIHLGTMTPVEAVDYLVDRVGHERKNAEGEVRRSVGGLYPPLYQAAYMLGGLQIRALHRELVVDGEWTERQFHDAVLQQNSIPIELLRAALKQERLERDFATRWRFYD